MKWKYFGYGAVAALLGYLIYYLLFTRKAAKGADVQPTAIQPRSVGYPANTYTVAKVDACLACDQAYAKEDCKGFYQYPQIYQQSRINAVYPFELGYYSDSNYYGTPGGIFGGYSFLQ
jgi:hypothetical protein